MILIIPYSLLTVLSLGAFTSALVIREHIEDVTNVDIPASNSSDRAQQAEDIFSEDDFINLDTERNISTKITDEYTRQKAPGSAQVPGTNSVPLNQTLGASGSNPNLPIPQRQGSLATFTSKQRRKREDDPELHMSGVRWPITTTSGETLAPIQRVSISTLEDLLSKAEADAANWFKNNDGENWRTPNGYYSYKWGPISLQLAEIPGVFNGTDSLDWDIFRWVASELLKGTKLNSDPKSYVGSISANFNSTVVAYFAVTWIDYDIIDDDQPIEHVWNQSSVAGNGGKLKPREYDLDNVIRRFPISMLPAMVKTGYTIVAWQGKELFRKAIGEHMLLAGATGRYFDTMAARTLSNQVFDLATAKENLMEGAPYYLAAEYYPVHFANVMKYGFNIVFAESWAASASMIASLMASLYANLGSSFWTGTASATVHSVHGTIEDPNGVTIAWYSVGEALVKTAIKAYKWSEAGIPQGAIVAGKFFKTTHNEL